MALSCTLRPLRQRLCISSALLSSLPGQDCNLLTEKKTAAKWKEKKMTREGCSLTGFSWEERLANTVTPLWRLPCQAQLQPVTNGYRNKSTFSVNRGPDGNPKTVGLYVGTGKARNIVCVKANHMENIPPTHKQVAQSPFQLLHGELHIFEEALGLKFRISPGAFFQVNTGGAEVLYQAVGELIQGGGDTVLLDIRCGTGTTGVSLAHQVPKIIGPEVVEKAVEDARWNAAFNDYRAVRAIRNCESIQRLRYISCTPEGEAMSDFLE